VIPRVDTAKTKFEMDWWINPDHKIYQKWRMFIFMIVALLVEYVIPLRLSFEPKRTISLWLTVLDTTIDIIMFIDSTLKFFIPLNVDGTLFINLYTF